MRENWTTFASNTTLHGLRFVVATSGPRRLFWALCLLACISAYMYIVVDSVAKFARYPINTLLSTEVPFEGIEFPDVTICNLNSLVKSKINVGYDDPRFEELNLNMPACDVMRNVSGNITCGQALLCAYSTNASFFVPQCDLSMHSKLRQALNTPSRIFNPEDFYFRYGHGFGNMLMNYCAFGQNQDNSLCNEGDFDPVVTEQGLCHTFNIDRYVKRTNGKSTALRIAGGEHGLSILLNAELDEYTFGEWSFGLRMIFGERGKGINRHQGILISPGSHAIVILSANKVKQLRYPFASNCSEKYLPGYQKYTKDVCFEQCLSNNTVKACGCRPIGERGLPKVPVCSIADEECRKEQIDNIRFPECHCNTPCEVTYYVPRGSFARFPNTMIMDIIRGYVKNGTSDDYIKENFILLQVGFEAVEYQVTELQPAYELGNLFGDLGGNMGLLLGCSVLTLVEFFDYVFMFIIDKIEANKNKVQVLTGKSSRQNTDGLQQESQDQRRRRTKESAES